MKTTATWVSNLAFDIESDNAHKIRLDTTVAAGSLNSGMSPKQVLLGSLCACTGIDVVSILEKMRVQYTSLIITAEAEQTTEHPKVFKEIFLNYTINCSEAERDKVEKAVHLSEEKYCGVSAMLKKHCAIHVSVTIQP